MVAEVSLDGFRRGGLGRPVAGLPGACEAGCEGRHPGSGRRRQRIGASCEAPAACGRRCCDLQPCNDGGNP